MLRRYVEQLLNIYNYIDGIMVVDKGGYIEYFESFRPDVNKLKEKNILHKHVTEVYPGLTNETSSVMRVLRTGEPILNEYQTLMTYNGQSIRAINTTMPIKQNNEIIGAVDASRYLDSPYRRQNITLKERKEIKTSHLYTLDDIITASKSMEIIKERIPMVANTDSSVLIYGETGTGKELVAQSIHTSSKRKNKRFVSQNCAAIPGNLLESILFGTTKGSYTGAENKAGLFEIANGGTLFLDEINSMEIGVQAKILKAIEEKQVCRLGGFDPIKIDVKIVSAANVQPLTCIETGQMREDLFYRLSVVQINIPPLRERLNDLVLLIGYFIENFNEVQGRDIKGVDEEVERIFQGYEWPGNVRELRNIIEGAFNVSASKFIQKKDLPEYLINPIVPKSTRENSYRETTPLLQKGQTLSEALNAYEKALIEDAIENSRTLVDAANQLGITKQSLHYKMGKYNLGK